MSFAARLASGEPIDEPVAVVVAHSDDETLWCGTALTRLRKCRLIHLTDSAPRDMGDAVRLGIGSRGEYAALRARELDRALVELDAAPERFGYGVPDKEAVDHLPELVERLTRDCAGVAAFLTHPYEGGHPDHDAAALAVRLVAGRIGEPAIVEFACYRQAGGVRVWADFAAHPSAPERVRALSPSERGRVDRALAAHASQAAVFGPWRPEAERWRDAPRYDFTRPAPGEAALYDGFGWEITSERWCQRARAVLRVAA